MSAQSMRTFGFLESRSSERDAEDAQHHPPGTPALVELLREWRAAERGLAGLEPGSDAWALLQIEIERLRRRYQDAFDEMNRQDAGSSTL